MSESEGEAKRDSDQAVGRREPLLDRLRRVWRNSIRWKIVAALVAVSVVPMLITSQIAASVVSATYTDNVQSWLFQIGRFFLASVKRGGEEIGLAMGAPEMLHRVDRIAAKVRSGEQLPPPGPKQAAFMGALGFDLLTLREPDGRLIYSNLPVDRLERLPFEQGTEVYLYRGGGKVLMMTGHERTVETSTGPVHVFAGAFLDASFIQDIETIGSLDMTLYYPIGGTYRQVYSSSSKTVGAAPSAEVLAELADLPRGSYLEQDGIDQGASIGILLPVRNGAKLVGVVACALDVDLDGAPIAGSNRLLWIIFVTGMGLAVVAGIALSSLVTRRVERLAKGVSAVAAGDFTQEMPVEGHDELDRLMIAFNAMSAQLQDYRQLQARLRRKERFATLGEVAAGFAHEVRNPLGIIKTTAELVGRKPDLTEADRRRLGYVADEVRRIDQLIRDFLVFARPAQRTSTVTAASLLERVLGLCGDEIARRGVALDVKDASGGALLTVDLDQMAQAFLNLVLNALDAMGEGGGSLFIEIAPPKAGNLSFLFRDTGPGIPPALLERIFDPFMTTKAHGTGLGLATVFAIVEGHGGWIEARNLEGGGALFELTLPVATPASQEPAP
ncbi:hypothetical protein NS365_15565 [Aureimonas ureilytica]|uniref:histidine kinase n=1 Tax=Aureimonas ureilytica TaxID=401562 RepID=A0A175RKV9_9HYPH|nr:HAMP domain-containing sensor histidine kinase [Aureimonas ureilytica]KTR04296.1 hypothetical protein NS365_15565 [Aureimonas ureilytica]